jgi:glycosyltransferase involved in cell wall biosynthesis
LKDGKCGKLEILASSNPVDTNGQPVLQYGEKDIDIIFCGRFVKQKGVLDFVKVVGLLTAKNSSLRAVMIGTGPEMIKVEGELHARNVKIELLGYLPDRDKLNLISRSKLFVFPSYEEGWGISVAEALKLGTPVLAYDLPIYKEVFAENIYTVPLANVTQLTQKTSEMLEYFKADHSAYNIKQQKLVAATAKYDTAKIMRAEIKFMLEEI